MVIFVSRGRRLNTILTPNNIIVLISLINRYLSRKFSNAKYTELNSI